MYWVEQPPTISNQNFMYKLYPNYISIVSSLKPTY